MKILAPADSPEEAARLAALGARELYGGFLTREWEERFGLDASANRRSFPEAQIGDEEALGAVVEAAHGGGAAFFLAVNAPYYTREQSGPLLRLVEAAVDRGVDALIAADAGLVRAVRERWPALPVHLSTMAEAANRGAVAFWRRLGVRRVTLPRHLSLAQIGRLAPACPGTAFDVFILYGQCPNAEGYCTFSHDDPGRRWPCVQAYDISGDGARDAVASRAATVQGAWRGLRRGDACGLCGLPALRRAGVAAVKIVGRGTSRERKEWAVSTLSRLIGVLNGAGGAPGDFTAAARELNARRTGHPCRRLLCYFPELLPPGEGGEE